MSHDAALRMLGPDDEDNGWRQQDPNSNRGDEGKAIAKGIEEQFYGSDTNTTALFVLYMTGEPSTGHGRISLSMFSTSKRKCVCENCLTIDKGNIAAYLFWCVRKKNPLLFQEYWDHLHTSLDAMDKNEGPPLS